MKCGVVYPVWVHIGWVQWQEKGREKLMTIERKTCNGDATVLKEWRGLKFQLCPEHAANTFLEPHERAKPVEVSHPITGCFGATED